MKDNIINNSLRKLPGVDKVLNQSTLKHKIDQFGLELVTYSIREVLQNRRNEIIQLKSSATSIETITKEVTTFLKNTVYSSFKPVINATGIILHTNLGRAPLGEKIFEDIKKIVIGHSNLEYDLETGQRGKRDSHTSAIIKFLTSAEDSVVVNNNAAGIILAINTLAKDQEVIISRSELIEIGGSFRIPDIMEAAGAKMVEVGTTNRTRLSDYQNAITEKTGMIFKAHKSNYYINGFTEEASLEDLANLANKNNIPFVYDIGSGLLQKPKGLSIENEPDVKSAIKAGADLVTFSGDKLLGGPQAGIITGKKELVAKLKKAPLMRALRVGKLTIAALTSACRQYLNTKNLMKFNPLFSILEKSPNEIHEAAHLLHDEFKQVGIESRITKNVGRPGGGTLPHLSIESCAVTLVPPKNWPAQKNNFAETIHHHLLKENKPIIGIMRQGELLFDLLTVNEEELHSIVCSTLKIINSVTVK